MAGAISLPGYQVAELVPPGYDAELLGQYSSIGDMDDIETIEGQQPEGTRMVVRLDFKWRFPFFKEMSGTFNWLLKHTGVDHWPEYDDHVVFVHESQPIWYIAWSKNAPWWQVIMGALVGFFSSTVGIALIAVFFGSLLWRIIPKEVREPVENLLDVLPPLLAMGAMMLMVQFVPTMAGGLSKRIAPSEEGE